MLNGKKTYIVAVITALAAFFAALQNEPYYGGLFAVIAAAALTLRDGIKKLEK